MKCRPMDDGTDPASVVSDPDNVLQGKEFYLNSKLVKQNSFKYFANALIWHKEEE